MTKDKFGQELHVFAKIRFSQYFSQQFCLSSIMIYFLQVFDQCYEGGAVSPTTCVYMKEWLEI